MANSTTEPTETDNLTLGAYLRLTRGAANLTLRQVEAATNKGVTNGYLSQIEKGDIAQPSPRVLHHLATVYGIDYGDLMVRAGHHVPAAENANDIDLNGFPLRAIAELTQEQREELLRYIAFIRKR
ncbi:helix-turn-helix transcriptional regulator [uncultured Microbacterium sp.]|uniref:helix-turn-helix domain-containing protein n=1 Tax=uncultured Microbacterium sp. TaxID=191216 RepID=UPI0025E82642|nr:helix-turn-helix transcriptional regulator [uncultured Microbacterium sp.]